MIGLEAAVEHSVDLTSLGTSLTPPTCDVTKYFKIRVRQGFYTVTLQCSLHIRDGSRLSNIRIFYLIIEYRLGCAIIF